MARSEPLKSLSIAALGSSFAAGPRIPPQAGPRGAGRSAQNYAHILAERLGADLTDLTVSGATLSNISHERQKTYTATFPPQIDGLHDRIQIVTITAGGNDLSYVGGLLSDTLNSYFVTRALTSVYNYFMRTEQNDAISQQCLAERYITVLEAIHAKSPKARVFVVEYLNLLGEDVQAQVNVPFNQAQLDHHREVAAVLQRATEQAAKACEEWCVHVPVHKISEKHSIGSSEPWVEGFTWGFVGREAAPFHPNADGMRAVADVLHGHIESADIS